MEEIAGYKIYDDVYQSQNTVIKRGERLHDSSAVLVKFLKSKHPTPQRVARLRHEYDIASTLKNTGILVYHSLEPYYNGWAIIMEDFQADSLADVYQNESPSILSFLETAAKISKQLGEIHKSGVIHKDIKPENIIINKNTGAIKIIDFGISTKLAHENTQAINPGKLEGTLAYISPEQTGRINRVLDYRTDLYSLGVTFYELLTGRLPFESDDPMEIIHGHIAREPDPPATTRNDEEIPLALRSIIARLMAKSSEDRYLSAFGVQADLEECRRLLQENNEEALIAFETGQWDISDQLIIPQKLYGRNHEVRLLLDTFERVRAGSKSLIAVAGSSGVGKSALINEINRPVASKGGSFLSGKFDQFGRDVPYSGLIQAFRELIRRILTDDQTTILEHKDRLVKFLGSNGQIIIDVIPEVQHIMGEQLPVPDISPTESQNRFRLVFLNFIRCFAIPGQPLCLFLDDLQWADSATLQLLRVLLTDQDTDNLLIIGAYRDNEVSEIHPLALFFEELATRESIVDHIKLMPLKIKAVYNFVADALHFESVPEEKIDSWVESVIAARAKEQKTPGDQAASFLAETPVAESAALLHGRDFVELVFKKTDGNPFFLAEYLKGLYDDGLLFYSSEERNWVWKTEQIKLRAMSDDVVGLLTNKITSLPDHARQVISYASGLGNRFSLRMLSLVTGSTNFETAGKLEAVLEAGFIIPADDSYKYVMRFGDESEGENILYSFVHDRVQQAAYAILDTKEQEQMHLRIAENYMDQLSIEQRDKRVIEIANHYIAARELLVSDELRLKVSQMCLSAGLRAKKSTAYDSAIRLFHIGLELLPGFKPPGSELVQNYYEMYIDFNRELGECYYVSEDLKRADIYFNRVIHHAKTGLEKLKIFEIKIAIQAGVGDYSQAVLIGLEALAGLGIKIQASPSKSKIQTELRRVRKYLRRHLITNLIDLPMQNDAHHLATMRLLMQISMPAHRLRSSLFPLIVARMVLLSLKHGNTTISSYAYAAYGMLLVDQFGDVESAHSFGRLGLDLLEKTQATELKCRVYYLYASTILPWKSHVEKCNHYLKEAYQAGLEVGDLQYVSYCIVLLSALPLWTGNLKLSSIERLLEKYDNALYKTGQQYGMDRSRMAWQYIFNMQGAGKIKHRLTGEKYDEKVKLEEYNSNRNSNGIFQVYFYKTILAGLFGRYDETLEFATAAKDHIQAASGSIALVILDFFECLAMVSVMEELNRADNRASVPLKKRINDTLARINSRAQDCPENFSHLSYLLEAQIARIEDQPGKAIQMYDHAIQKARENNFILYEGLACELAAQFYFLINKTAFAALYLRDARVAYLNCRATGKASELEIRYEKIFHQMQASAENASSQTASASQSFATDLVDTTDQDDLPDDEDQITTKSKSKTLTLTMSSDDSSMDLDTMTIIKASQAIAGEIHLPQLLERLLRIVMENAGAQRGILILENDGKWCIQASGNIRDEKIIVLQDTPFESSDDLALSVVRLVLRTQEEVVLNDASVDEQFGSDIYIKDHKLRSMLCLPVKMQGQLSGILYLENNSARGIFTKERINVLGMLSSQIATSIENARLYSNLENALEQERLARQAEVALNEASARFVPNAFLHLLGQERIVDLKIGEHTSQSLAVMFSDIRDFTSLSESMSPAENFGFINSYLKRMGPIVRDNNGFIDKYIGDAIMALFTTADDAIKGAIEMLELLKDYNKNREKTGYRPVKIGIGLHVGQVMLGIIGEEHRLEGTVISDTVNLASRLEGLTKHYGTSLIISKDTLGLLKNSIGIEARIIDQVRVKGKTSTVELVEILNGEDEDIRKLKMDTRNDFEQATLMYRASEFQNAIDEFTQIYSKNKHDRAAALYIKRAQSYLKDGPPKGWDGFDSIANK